jgi:hypothetical protein
MGEALLYWRAFKLLDRDRPWLGGFVPTPRAIPIEAIRAEADARGLIGDERQIFIDVLADVDDFWVETEMNRLAKESSERRNRHRPDR